MQNVVIYIIIDMEPGTLRQVFICLRPPSLSIIMGWSSNFEGSDSGQQNMISHTTQHPFPLPVTHCLYIVLHVDTGMGRSRSQIEGKRENRSQSWAENTNMNECTQEIGYLQSKNFVC